MRERLASCLLLANVVTSTKQSAVISQPSLELAEAVLRNDEMVYSYHALLRTLLLDV